MPKSEVIARTIGDIVRAHHDAFLVEVLGPGRSGLSPERIEELIDEGLITNKDLQKFLIPGMSTALDPFSFMYAVSRVFDETPADKHETMRTWTLDQWKSEIDTRSGGWMNQGALEIGGAVRVNLPKPDLPVSSAPSREPDDAPWWMSSAEKESYRIATARAGEYARHLGTLGAQESEEMILEEWDGEEIVMEVDAQRRAETRELIQEAVGEALTHKDPNRLASDLAEKTENWTHNWDRIARTELQSAYNDGRVLDAIEAYGDRAQVARFPESGACPECVMHYAPGGVPTVFPVEELVANGTNVGRKRSSWLPTLYPMHPNCRCDTIVVPPGMQVRSDGGLEVRKET